MEISSSCMRATRRRCHIRAAWVSKRDACTILKKQKRDACEMALERNLELMSFSERATRSNNVRLSSPLHWNVTLRCLLRHMLLAVSVGATEM
jgi:hypothetical protein